MCQSKTQKSQSYSCKFSPRFIQTLSTETKVRPVHQKFTKFQIRPASSPARLQVASRGNFNSQIHTSGWPRTVMKSPKSFYLFVVLSHERYWRHWHTHVYHQQIPDEASSLSFFHTQNFAGEGNYSLSVWNGRVMKPRNEMNESSTQMNPLIALNNP